jgi:hypothetical protein
MRHVLGILAVSLLILSGCALPKEAHKTTIADLLAHKKEYRGKRVEVTGFYLSGPELSALYQTEDDAQNYRSERALWIMPFARRGYEGRLKPVREGFVRVVGIFTYNLDPMLGVGHSNQWPAEINTLELFEIAQ